MRFLALLPLAVLAGCPAHDGPAATDAATPAPAEPVTPAEPTTPTVPGTDVPTTGTPTANTPAGEAATGPDTWTAGVVTQKREGLPARVTAVRTGRHEGFDRIVFEFAGTTVPGWHLEYVDKPVRDCAAGEVVDIRGDGWLLVQLAPAWSHDDAGTSSTPKEQLPALPNLLEIERTCDFEAVTAYVAGVAAPNKYRVFELAEPARLVVDIQQ